MTHDVVMPHLGLTMEEGSVVSWRKQLGERVEKGEILFTVETDKVEMEVESTEAGYLNAIYVQLGEKVPVGSLIAILGDKPEEVATEPRSVATSGTQAAKTTQSESEVHREDNPASAISPAATVSTRDKYPVSPRARRLAQELGIDLALIKPGQGVRIVENDVRQFVASRQAPPATDEAPGISRRSSAARQVIAQRMAESFHTAPHFYLGIESNAAELVRFRNSLLEPCQEKNGVRLTYTDLFLRALALGLKNQPQVNAFWHRDAVQLRHSIDVGFAAQTEAGLIVPVIRKADELSLFDLARQRHALAEKAKDGSLSLAEMEGGSATLSNLGSTGVDWFQAILNPPQSVILATGRIAKRVAVVNDRVEVCPTVVLSLSVDHRVLDGVAGAAFLDSIRRLIENPSAMLL